MNHTEAATIATALRQFPPSESELIELVRLYAVPGGFPYTMDVGGRPQAETLGQCRRVGSRLNRGMGSPYSYGMNVVGKCDVSTGTWQMRPEFRKALELANLVQGPHVAPAEPAAGDVDAQSVMALEAGILADETLSETEKEQLIRARLGQGKFRAAVLQFERACRLTGTAHPELLHACHIKPWACASNLERLNGANGLMLAPSMHVLFDKGYITFDDAGKLLLSSKLPADVASAWSVRQIVRPRPFTPERLEFLRFQQRNVFRG